MGKIYKHPDVKLMAGFIFNDENAQRNLQRAISRKFGKVDFESDIMDFSQTDYYRGEMGPALKRKFISFLRLAPIDKTQKIKIYTNKLENKYRRGENRSVNIDPGYVTASKLVLFTTKNHQHRIYVGNGVYAEVTLRFQGGSFRAYE